MDIHLHFTESGSGEPLVLLHGNGEDGSYFEHQIERFRTRYRVIAVDTRGHGASPRGTAPFTLDQFVLDLAAFLDENGIAVANVLGFSDGANIAIMYALAHPDRVKKLVINGGNLFPEGLTSTTRRGILAEYKMARALGDERQQELMRLMIDEPHIDPARLSSLNMPVLVIAGTDDMIEESHTKLIAASIPGAQLQFVDGGHFIASENPSAFNRAVAAFLDSA